MYVYVSFTIIPAENKNRNIRIKKYFNFYSLDISSLKPDVLF
jgi:hypothetical protein